MNLNEAIDYLTSYGFALNENSTKNGIAKLKKLVKSKKIEITNSTETEFEFFIAHSDKMSTKITVSILNEAYDITVDNNVSTLCKDFNEAYDTLSKILKENLNEDFSMGVGSPMGLDQGIPHGGDCKGVAPQHMGLYQRSPFSRNPFFKGVPDAHHPIYWLNQTKPLRRKKKKRKKKTV